MSIFVYLLLLPPIVFCWYIFDVLMHVCWWNQKRWVVWYPPTKHGPAMWSGEASKPMCDNYAEIFGGTVYRVR